MQIPTFTSTLDDQDLGVAIVQNGKDIFFPEHARAPKETLALTLDDINAQIAASLGKGEELVIEPANDPPENDALLEAFLAEKNGTTQDTP